jgi:dienelactone hydrolase
MPQTPMNEQVLQVPGNPADPVMLQVTVFTPDGPGPFPMAVINHGAPRNGGLPRDEPRHRVSFAADYFLSRGYAVVMPMMRGFAGSGGRLQAPGCDYESFALGDAADIRAVIDYMTRQPYVDASRIVVAGQSFGAWNTLALGTLNIPNVKGLVNFVGGMHSSDCRSPDNSLIKTAGRFGAKTSIPSIWFYGDNDKIFSVPTWRGMYDRYTRAGGKVELVAFGKFEVDSHELLSSYEGLRIWTPKVDAFLDRIGLPSTPVLPKYMPIAPPPPSHYAVVGDVDAVPYLTDQGRDLYRKFLASPFPRAFAVATNGSVSSESKGFDPLLLAQTICQKSGHPCRLYAVDGDVVWSRPTPEPAPTNFAAVTDAAAVPYLNDKARNGYRTFLTMRKPRAFVIAPDGGWDAAALGPDPLAFALDHCAKQHKGCQLYAVDNDVVWPAASARTVLDRGERREGD